MPSEYENDPRDTPPENVRSVLAMLDLAKAHIEIGDVNLASKNTLACLFAVAALTDRDPESVADDIRRLVPNHEEWREAILPDLLGEMP